MVAAGQLRKKDLDKLAGKRVLKSEDVRDIFIDRRRPNRGVVLYIQKLNRDTKAVFCLLYISIKNEIDVELASGLYRIARLVAK